jgi:hypothetical protein
MLKTIVDVIPILSEGDNFNQTDNVKHRKITKASLYKISTKKYFETQEMRTLKN